MMSRRHRGCHMDSPRRRAAAPPRLHVDIPPMAALVISTLWPRRRRDSPPTAPPCGRIQPAKRRPVATDDADPSPGSMRASPLSIRRVASIEIRSVAANNPRRGRLSTRRVSADDPRRRRDAPPSTKDPRGSRGGAATRLRERSTWHPRRRRHRSARAPRFEKSRAVVVVPRGLRGHERDVHARFQRRYRVAGVFAGVDTLCDGGKAQELEGQGLRLPYGCPDARVDVPPAPPDGRARHLAAAPSHRKLLRGGVLRRRRALPPRRRRDLLRACVQHRR